ncbi:MAG: hypothetical protein KBD00_03960 [Candidatus Peribacteraceae bacterium]|nr:hypothetical protein [Candidatus Peribacteraceae bacterium]
MAFTETPDRARQSIDSADTKNPAEEARMTQRVKDILGFKERYRNVMNTTGFGSKSTTITTLKWLTDFEATDDTENQKSIYWREDFIKKSGLEVVEKGEILYEKFTSEMRRAAPYMSEDSKKRWMDRFYDTSAKNSSESSFETKSKWISGEMSKFVDRWIKVVEEREKIMKDPRFNNLLKMDPELQKMQNKEEFLNMHYDKRKNLVDRAKAALHSKETGNEDLHKRAKQILAGPVKDGAISADRVGSLLKRIFDGVKSRKEIEEYLNSGIHNDIRQRYQVLSKYDAIASKIQKRGKVRVRGMNLIPRAAFTKMTYKERLAYVKEMDLRLVGANDIRKENPLFLTIRHLLDMKDWKAASEKIKQAEATRETMSDSEKSNIDSMKNYLKRMRKDKKGAAGTKEKKSPMEEANIAVQTMNNTVRNMDTSMRPMVERLLRSSHANRNIHQLRWGIYNRTWCENRGYLDNDKLRKGASKKNRMQTKWRGDRGLDIGREDNLDGTTAHAAYVRKEEHAKNKPTNLHLDIKDGAATQKLAEFMETEQPPKRLYWLNICANNDGNPKPSEWNKKFIAELTVLRSCAKTMEKAGLMYGGLGLPAVSFKKTAAGPPIINN